MMKPYTGPSITAVFAAAEAEGLDVINVQDRGSGPEAIVLSKRSNAGRTEYVVHTFVPSTGDLVDEFCADNSRDAVANARERA